VDAVTAWLLEHGLHLVAAVAAAPEAAPGWTVGLHGPPGIRGACARTPVARTRKKARIERAFGH
jgi:hypothetical protein